LFSDGRYWSHRKPSLAFQSAFSVFNLTWRGTRSTIHADQQLSLIINLFAAFQPILAESSSIVGTYPGSSLHVWFNDKIPDKMEKRLRNGLLNDQLTIHFSRFSFCLTDLLKREPHGRPGIYLTGLGYMRITDSCRARSS
jgi:hypothetical protein